MRSYTFLFITFLLSSCVSIPDIQYHLVKPKSDDLSYKGKYYDIKFFPKTNMVYFEVTNTSNSNLVVKWDYCSIIDSQNNYLGVYHGTIKFDNRSESSKESLIIPSARLSDVLIPIETTNYNSKLGWSVGQFIKSKKGVFKFVFAYEIDGQIFADVYEFDYESDSSFREGKSFNNFD